MNNWLKALSFWVWGLIAIGLSASLVSVSYRMVSLYRSHSAFSTSVAANAADSKATAGVSNDSGSVTSTQPMISRAVAKDYMAAQKAYQAKQWSEVIQDLEPAEAKLGITNFDKMHIYDMKGYAYIKL